jgi:serine/threonine protein phosphatase PrpC
MNAINDGYHQLRYFLNEISGIYEQSKNLAPMYSANKTVFLTGNGASISVGMASDVGMVRTLNEDSVSVFELTNILQSVTTPYGLYMVADGMGGHSAGEEASKIAVEYITRKIIGSFNNSFETIRRKARQLLEEAVFSANREICKISDLKNSDMGTTLNLAFVASGRAFILNVGDARAYLYSNGKLQLITEDHSLVYRLYKIGQLQYHEIYQHPSSNQILCALGEPNLQQSLENLEQKANHPYFFEISMEKGDGLLLCTDGLWQMIPDYKIEEILNRNSQPQMAVDALVNVANNNGGDDNISLIFVKTH